MNQLEPSSHPHGNRHHKTHHPQGNANFGIPVASDPGKVGSGNHFEIHLMDKTGTEYRAAVNCLSDDGSELQYHYIEPFNHPYSQLMDQWLSSSASNTVYPLTTRKTVVRLTTFGTNHPSSLSDFKNMHMRSAGPENALQQLIQRNVEQIVADQANGPAYIICVGDHWRPESKPDQEFGFTPGNGIHNIHMKQNDDSRHRAEDGPWQDGAIFFRLANGSYNALFTKFQTQSWTSS
ncbi:hypothetical protein BZG36_02677 [Bifiguratus adelaidae]|uniref:Uncharacterized protein n=1 Tax=Bifiguratus adelaidae TaxID=1938954 RepID=A0A261Y1I1_9FUNG|nr:hypothetical protein BZG36_02677 [Bifiguratus adelaidae]